MDDTSDLGWTVSIEVEDRDAEGIDDDAAWRFSKELAGHGGAISAHPRYGRYGSTFSLYGYENADPWQVLRRGIWVFTECARRAGLPIFPLVRAEILTFAEHDREGLDSENG